MRVEVLTDHDPMTIRLSGRLDETGAERLNKILEGIDPADHELVVFDFQGVNYISSSGLGKILMFYKRALTVGHRISIVNASGSVMEMLRLTRLDSLFEVRPQ